MRLLGEVVLLGVHVKCCLHDRVVGMSIRIRTRQAAEEQIIFTGMRSIRVIKQIYVSTYIGCLASHLSGTCAWLQPVFQEPGASRLIAVDSSIRSTTRLEAPSSDCTRSPDEISTIGFSTSNWPEQIFRRRSATAAAAQGRRRRREWRGGEGGYA
ncbi:GDSL esterase/lipase-like [Dorcoceras hygrometricum]|uniref:GDSL esterase/lipase-like n=1 Tax=Dorcoceras hygrometricum TaxID=472368 RepID=A0A2Z7B004_9LAMI|nr:GDSL esterase/lipase-like [Dorcoceras hygrometricum]